MVYKKQKIVPGKFDVDKQELFKLEYSLLKGNIKAKEAIHFMDSVFTSSVSNKSLLWLDQKESK